MVQTYATLKNMLKDELSGTEKRPGVVEFQGYRRIYEVYMFMSHSLEVSGMSMLNSF